jgi:hypothetical protein
MHPRRMRGGLSEAQIADLSKFNHALGIESNGFCFVKDAEGLNEERGTGP